MTTKEHLLEHLEKMQSPNGTSMNVWGNYWLCRVYLRQMALECYEEVTIAYVDEGHDLAFPSEGFKEIADDVSRGMETVAGVP